MDKNRLRRQLLDGRKSLNAKEAADLSQRISANALEILNMLSFSSLHIYLPEKKLREVGTWPLIKAVQQKWPGVKIAYAPFNGPIKFESLWLGTDKKVSEDFQFDLIIVPQLGFDDHGYRLGYGGGFYDRFLAKQKTNNVIGLCYEAGHLASLPHEPHDIPIKSIVTEKQIYQF